MIVIFYFCYCANDHKVDIVTIALPSQFNGVLHLILILDFVGAATGTTEMITVEI